MAILKSSRGVFLAFSCLLLAAPLQAGFVIGPTLLSSDGPTLVKATTTGSTRFYTGPTPPPYRVSLTHQGVAVKLLTPESLSPTMLSFLFPRLDPGFYPKNGN